ncbi:MAG: hypothetical protein GY705_23830 [Bacteroidetes bacterium]|nr:hypothetical protein [Bacteroidota bacterium]
MPRQKTDYLIQLINSLNRAEKRHFRVFVKRNQSSDNILFLQLFDHLDRYKHYDEGQILKRLPDIKKQQLSNLKAHLYKQLLISLRLLNKNYDQDIELREMIDYAKVLYNKGLYRQSLDILDKCKSKALAAKQNTLALNILEFEKFIESQYITRSIETRAEDLAHESMRLNKTVYQSHVFSNLSIQLYGLYLKVGYVRNKKDYYFVKEFFQSNLPEYQYKDLGFYEKVFLCQSYVWYSHMTQDFLYTYKYAQKWVDLFQEHPEMMWQEAPLYLKGIHNLLSALFHLLHFEKFRKMLKTLDEFKAKYEAKFKQVNNIEGLYYLYYYIHLINKHYIEGTFSEGTEIIPELGEIIETNRYNWDNHRLLVFYYRIASLYFGSGDLDNTIHYLNIIINQKSPDFRGDIQCFARILNLIAHFELGNAQLVEYQVKSVYRFLGKMEDLQQVQKEVFRFLRKTPKRTI